MFEDRTFEEIMNEMLEDPTEEMDVSEGSLIWTATAKNAIRMEDVYAQLDALHDNMYPDTADLEHLILFGAGKGIYIKEATPAVFKAKFNIPVEVGERFSGDDFDYIVTESISEEEYMYKVECEDDGSEPNTFLTELQPIEELEGFEHGELIELLVPGVDEEDEEALRQRIMEDFGTKECAGNKKYYKSALEEMEGVGGAKTFRREEGADNFFIKIISEEYRKPDEAKIQEIQEKVDPLPGEGEGIAPIGHKPVIIGADEEIIDIEIALEFKDGYDYDSIRSYIEQAIDGYFLELRKTWVDTDKIIVRISQIETRIISIEGIEDALEVLIDGTAKNKTLDQDILPVRGELICR